MSFRPTSCRRLAAAAGAIVPPLALSPSAGAQEAFWMPAATQPSPGQWIVTEKARYYQFRDDDPADPIDSIMAMETTLAYGLVPRLSMQLDLPAYWKQSGTPQQTTAGLGDLSMALKVRVLQEDLGPVDTVRAAVVGGVMFPTGTSGFGSTSFNPYLGAVVTGIFGRHGLNASATWRFTTGATFDPVFAGETTADLLELDASYAFRLSPEEYTEVHEPALYVVGEFLGEWEMDGQYELFLAPGLLWEAQRAALEISVRIPVAQQVSNRPKSAWAVSFGVRLLF
ncbi:MAG: hypothetical protein ACO3NL_15225 [Phycisphaerales bacterium]